MKRQVDTTWLERPQPVHFNPYYDRVIPEIKYPYTRSMVLDVTQQLLTRKTPFAQDVWLQNPPQIQEESAEVKLQLVSQRFCGLSTAPQNQKLLPTV